MADKRRGDRALDVPRPLRQMLMEMRRARIQEVNAISRMIGLPTVRVVRPDDSEE